MGAKVHTILKLNQKSVGLIPKGTVCARVLSYTLLYWKVGQDLISSIMRNVNKRLYYDKMFN